MATPKDNMASIAESTLETITSIQQRIVEAQKEFASTIAGLVPELPSWLQTPDLPDTPDLKEIVEQNFAFQEQMLEANKAFSLGLIDAWSQAAPKKGGTSKSDSSAKK